MSGRLILNDFRCRYCRGRFSMGHKTRDHVVPVWVIRSFPELHHYATRRNVVNACRRCNNRKKGLPAAVFVRVMSDNDAYSQAVQVWETIAARIRNPYTTWAPGELEKTRELVRVAYQERIGGEYQGAAA